MHVRIHGLLPFLPPASPLPRFSPLIAPAWRHPTGLMGSGAGRVRGSPPRSEVPPEQPADVVLRSASHPTPASPRAVRTADGLHLLRPPRVTQPERMTFLQRPSAVRVEAAPCPFQRGRTLRRLAPPHHRPRPPPAPPHHGPAPGPTYGLDDSLLEHALFVLFDDLGAQADGPVVAPGEGVVDAEPQLPQQSVEHLQHRGP